MGYPVPKLRADLTVRAQVSKAGKVYVVKDPVSNRFFRFGEAEELILRQLDGKSSLEGIRRKVGEALGGEIEAEVLTGFLRELKAGGLLEEEGGAAARVRQPGRRFRGTILFARFRLFDPTQVFDRLAGISRIFFTPAFLVVSALLILGAADLVIVRAGDLSQEFRANLQPSTLPLSIVIALLTVGLHEFAHGLTCRYFGGEVREIGFLLIYFQPALYCNVSDAWLFPEKAKRLWVSFAGPYFELFVWALAVFIWNATEPNSFLNLFALIVTAISGIKTLLNFNPLIKLDGYYMLSDFLEIPNLRAKSFQMVGNLMRGGGLGTGEERRLDRVVCLAYGLIASIGSIAVIGSLVAGAFRHLGAESGSVLLAVPVLFGIGIRVRRMASRFSGGGSAALDEDDADESGSKEKTARPPRADQEKPERREARPTSGAGSGLGWLPQLARVTAGLVALSAVAGQGEIRPASAAAGGAAVEEKAAPARPRAEGRWARPRREARVAAARAAEDSGVVDSRARNRAEYTRRKLERARSLFAEGLLTEEALRNIEGEAAESGAPLVGSLDPGKREISPRDVP